MPRRFPRRRRVDRSATWGWIAGSVGVLVVVLMLVTPFLFDNVPLDEYGCPITGSNYKTVILLDTSDPLSDKQNANLDIFLGCLMGNIDSGTVSVNQACVDYVAINKHERLAAYQLSEDTMTPVLLQSGCSPGNVHRRNLSDRLSEGRRFARARWEQFKLDIYGSFERSRLSAGSRQTLLLEGIQYVASKEFSPPNVARRLARLRRPEGRLIIISDFIQNSDSLNQFRSLGKISGALRDYPFSLAATKVEMRYLKRLRYAAYQTPEHQSWWAELLNYRSYGVPEAEIW